MRSVLDLGEGDFKHSNILNLVFFNLRQIDGEDPYVGLYKILVQPFGIGILIFQVESMQ